MLRPRRNWTRGVAAQHASLSRWRSPVRIRSGPPVLFLAGRTLGIVYWSGNKARAATVAGVLIAAAGLLVGFGTGQAVLTRQSPSTRAALATTRPAASGHQVAPASATPGTQATSPGSSAISTPAPTPTPPAVA